MMLFQQMTGTIEICYNNDDRSFYGVILSDDDRHYPFTHHAFVDASVRPLANQRVSFITSTAMMNVAMQIVILPNHKAYEYPAYHEYCD